MATCSSSAPAQASSTSAAAAPQNATRITLPVLATASPASTIKKSRNGPRRAIVLASVHVLIALHVAHWLSSGSTLSPVEPSESMKTLELGQLNAGAIFFAAAIAATLLFGRFFCGWGCHIVALQDLCGWLMKKCGVRPKPFRSRLLVFIPLGLAIYMFIWPTLKREALGPLLKPVWPTVSADLRITPFPDEGFTNHLMTEGFWDTFPGIAIAIPFLLVCGFATVYFLGAKGFCTYGCPYGGLFGPADLVSPGKIIVDQSKCHQCGHCTAVCTSNVRVHDEVREYGKVVDPGCMKCLDCVSVCPNGALSFGFAAPSIFTGAPKNKRPRKVYDTTIAEDLALGGVFLITLWCVRGAYGVIPLLMAVGIAGILSFVLWKSWRMVVERDVRFSVFQLKRLGAPARAGYAWLMLVTLGVLATAHTGYVKLETARGDAIYEALNIPKTRVLTPGAPPLDEPTIAQARAGIEHYRHASAPSAGGVGLMTPPAIDFRRALLHLAVGEPELAEAAMRRATAGHEPSDEGVADLGRVIAMRGDVPGAIALFDDVLERHPEHWSTRETWAALLLSTGRVQDVIASCEAALKRLPPERFTREANARTRLILARGLMAARKPNEALEQLKEAVETAPEDATIRENLAAALAQAAGNLPGAIEQLSEAVRLDPGGHMRRFQLGRLLLQTGRNDAALEQFLELRRRDPVNPERDRAVATMLERAGMSDAAKLFAP